MPPKRVKSAEVRSLSSRPLYHQYPAPYWFWDDRQLLNLFFSNRTVQNIHTRWVFLINNHRLGTGRLCSERPLKMIGPLDFAYIRLLLGLCDSQTWPPSKTVLRHFFCPTTFSLFRFYMWASALCTFYNNPAPLNGSMQFHYCTLVTREPEQTTLLCLKVAACGVTPHGLHTADRR